MKKYLKDDFTLKVYLVAKNKHCKTNKFMLHILKIFNSFVSCGTRDTICVDF